MELSHASVPFTTIGREDCADLDADDAEVVVDADDVWDTLDDDWAGVTAAVVLCAVEVVAAAGSKRTRVLLPSGS